MRAVSVAPKIRKDMLDMLLNLQPQGLAQGQVQEGGEKQAEKLLKELGLGEVSEAKDFVSLLKGEQQALSEKGLQEAKEVLLELAQSGKEAASELGLEILSKLPQQESVPAAASQNTQKQNPLASLLQNTESQATLKDVQAQSVPNKELKPQTLMEKIWPSSKEGTNTKVSAEESEALKEMARLKSHGPELTQKMNAKSQNHIKPGLMTAEDFLGQKQLKSADPEVANQNMKSQQMNTQMLQKYENGQKVVDRQMISLKGSSPQVSTEGSLKSPVELEAEAQKTDSAKLLKEVGVMKAPDAPKAAGMGAKSVDIGSSNTLDISKMDMSKPQQVIDKIVEYIDKAQFERTQKLDLVVKHEKLGQFQMQVSKSGLNSELIDLKIQAQGSEAHNFFKENELDLMKALNKNGVRLGDFKLTQSSEGSSLSQNSDSNKESQSGQGQKFSQSHDQDKDQAKQDSQRRKTLWQQYQERYGA